MTEKRNPADHSKRSKNANSNVDKNIFSSLHVQEKKANPAHSS